MGRGQAQAPAALQRLRVVLPAGGTLPRGTWEARHRWLVRLLWVGTAAVTLKAAFATASAASAAPPWTAAGVRAAWTSATTPAGRPVLAALALLVALAVVASCRWTALPERWAGPLRAASAATGVMACAVTAGVVADAEPEAHFLLFIAVPLIALHEAWTPYLAAAGTGLVAQASWAWLPGVHTTAGGAHLQSAHDAHGAAGVHTAHSAAGMLVPGTVGAAAVSTGLLALACLGALFAWRGAEVARAAVTRRIGELEHRARHDALTGLLDRRGHSLVLDAALRSGDGAGTGRVSLVLLDLDRFKEVNDTLGHAAGDELLVGVSRVLRRSAEAVETSTGRTASPVRLGGDEFAVVMPGAGAAEALALAELVVLGLRTGLRVGSVDVDQRVSCGVATHLGGGPLDAAGRRGLAEELLRRADVALYAAKALDDDVVEHTAALDEASRRRAGLLRDLRTALTRDDQLLLHFQPMVGLTGAAAGRVVGVEAFVRWQHPVLGLLPPGEFLDAAAAGGMDAELGAEVLRLALVQAGRWADAGQPVPVSVNATRHGLLEPGFAAVVARALAEHRVPPHLLRLEVTEGDVVEDPVRALQVISELREMGVATSVDDFGTGYSSLAHLRRLPVAEVKLDRSFVAGLGQAGPVGADPQHGSSDGHDGADEVLVGSVIGLAHQLGLQVVAEGVERPEEAEVLRRLGCDAVQGHLLAPPAPPGPLPPGTLLPAAVPAVSRGADARGR